MSELPRDTIFALSSGRGPSAIAVVRISGPRAGDALKVLAGRMPAPRTAQFARLRDPASGEVIDEALALWFPAPASETGEDVAELQVHGGRAVLAALFAALGRIDGLRPAEAGEFTRRAFENGKLDLTAVEGLADLIGAETEGQRRQALGQLRGGLGKRAEAWRETIVGALALVEARIDFGDEGDVPEDLVRPALDLARGLAAEIEAALADGRRGERMRDGLVVAIAGPPNAGKSTLLNRLARREVAIVSPYAGTTRDVIEVHLDLDGLPMTLLDTAGIRDTSDPVEQEGVRRARERVAAADLVLWIDDIAAELGVAAELLRSNGALDRIAARNAAAGPQQEPEARRDSGPIGGARTLNAGLTSVVSEIGGGIGAVTIGVTGRGADGAAISPVWRVYNKIDLISQGGTARSEAPSDTIGRNDREIMSNDPSVALVNPRLHLENEPKVVNIGTVEGQLSTFAYRNESNIDNNDVQFNISACSGEGLERLVEALSRFAHERLGAEPAVITRERHRRALEDALAALQRSCAPETAAREDLLAEELRLAARALARLTGRVDVEDVLDVIFRDFCIGK